MHQRDAAKDGFAGLMGVLMMKDAASAKEISHLFILALICLLWEGGIQFTLVATT